MSPVFSTSCSASRIGRKADTNGHGLRAARSASLKLSRQERYCSEQRPACSPPMAVRKLCKISMVCASLQSCRTDRRRYTSREDTAAGTDPTRVPVCQVGKASIDHISTHVVPRSHILASRARRTRARTCVEEAAACDRGPAEKLWALRSPMSLRSLSHLRHHLRQRSHDGQGTSTCLDMKSPAIFGCRLAQQCLSMFT